MFMSMENSLLAGKRESTKVLHMNLIRLCKTCFVILLYSLHILMLTAMPLIGRDKATAFTTNFLVLTETPQVNFCFFYGQYWIFD